MSLDMIGNRYGRLTVIRDSGERRRGETLWLCHCDCGNSVVLRGSSLRGGNNRSCGCLRDESQKTRSITHGCTGTRLYHIWNNMIQRCYQPHNKRWDCYGERGIRVCDEWRDFGNFQKWALENGYSDDLTIDRIDNDGNYEPSNCRWADVGTQANNKSTNHYLEHKGKKLTLTQLARAIGMSPKTLSTRLCRGWSVERALNTPIRKE